MATSSITTCVSCDNPRLIPSSDPRVHRCRPTAPDPELSFDDWQFETHSDRGTLSRDGYCLPPPALRLLLAELRGHPFAALATAANLRKIPPLHAKVFIMFYWQDCTHEEIAEALDITPLASRMMLLHARRELEKLTH